MTVKDRIMGEANAAYLSKEESSFITNENYSLHKSTLLDSATTIHISNDLSRFQNFKKAPRNHVVRCGGCGSTDFHVRNERNALSVFRIQNVAYCPDFMTNLVSLVKLKKRDIYWNTEKNVLYRAKGHLQASRNR
jgi:Pol polyprotein